MPSAPAPALEVRPAAERAAAGEAIGGRLVGFEGVVEVTLVRYERSPARVAPVECAAATLRVGAARRFALDVPAGLPPTSAGERCSIDYAITAKEALGDGRGASAPLVLTAAGRPHLRADGDLGDRALGNAAARRFHLELATADLRGGGHIAGRVHRHERWAPGAPTVVVSCLEAWRPTAAPLSALPHWDSVVLWTARTKVDVDRDRTWVPFEFDLPDGLPPAVEGRTMAWRYEVVARLGRRMGTGGHAVLTPLLFEAA